MSRLEATRARAGEPPIEVSYRRLPFILRPERRGQTAWLEVLRKLGISRGNPGWVDGFVPSMTAAGREVGVAFDFGGDVGNSMDSLRMMHWSGELEAAGAASAGVQENLAVELARGHFELRKCVADRGAVMEACRLVGLPETEAERVWDSGEYEEAVLEELDAAERSGTHAIPVVRIAVAGGGKRGIETQGAQSAEMYLKQLQAVVEAARSS